MKRIMFCLVIMSIFGSVFLPKNVTAAIKQEDYGPNTSYYTGSLPEPGPVAKTATPPEAVESKVEIQDGFTFPGIYNADVTTQFDQRNNAYLSSNRKNVAIVYDGTAAKQKSMFWYKAKLDLNKPFRFESYVYLGYENPAIDGSINRGVGDGIAMVFQNDHYGARARGELGQGIGVWPGIPANQNGRMIYNALGIEMDTYGNTGWDNNLDAQIQSRYGFSWPHIAMSTTATLDKSGNYTTYLARGLQNQDAVFNNFQHYGVTVPQNQSDGIKNWFKNWVKLDVQWTPNVEADGSIKTGNLSYTWGPTTGTDKRTYPTQTWNNIDIDKTFQNTANNPSSWDRKILWGFTGGNNHHGNAFGVMFTKLPNNSEVEVDRKVINVTKKETDKDYATSKAAKAGDVLQYKIKVKNLKTEVSLPLRETLIKEQLKSTEYVEGSFTYSSSTNKDVKVPVPSVDSTTNTFSFEDKNNVYGADQEFEYTYQVKVAEDPNLLEHKNDVSIEAVYLDKATYGKTVVNIEPENVTLTKTLDNDNPKVGDEVTVQVEGKLEKGTLLLSGVNDKLPMGFSVVSGSSKLEIFNKDNTADTTLTLTDAVWKENADGTKSLDVNTSNTPKLPTLSLIGGTEKNTHMRLTYKIKPTSENKGKQVTLGKTEVSGTNKLGDVPGTIETKALSNEVGLKVKTDITIYFKDTAEVELDKSWITSSNEDFHQKNPVVIYKNTGDAYDYTQSIKDISDKILSEHNYKQVEIKGDQSSLSLPETGNVITVVYSSQSKVIVNFVDNNKKKLHESIEIEGNIGSSIDLTKEKAVTDVLNTIKADRYVLETSGRPANETAIVLGKDAEATYTFNGTLSIYSGPKEINFGTHGIKAEGIKSNNPTYDQPLVIWDNRTNLNNWKLSLKLEDDLRMPTSPKHALKGVLSYQTEKEEKVLSTEAQEILTAKHDTSGQYDVSAKTWGPNKQGLRLNVPSGAVRLTGDYETTMVWSIEEAY